MKNQDFSSSPKKDGFRGWQKWLEYFDQFWGSKLKKLENLLNDKTTKK